jgi:hypothetical protein
VNSLGVAEASKNVPEASKNVPEALKNVPEALKNVPEIFKNISEVFKKVPDVLKNVLDVFQNVPRALKNVPQALRKVLGESRNLLRALENESRPCVPSREPYNKSSGSPATVRRDSLMPTLVIHAPSSLARLSGYKSFDQIVSDGKAMGYAIPRGLFQQLSPDDPVVVICNAHQKQASGRIEQLVPTEKAGNGQQRYDVVIKDLRPERYTHAMTPLGRSGVAVV